MHVEVSATSITVSNADNCDDLDVLARGTSRDEVTRQLARTGLGALADDGTVALDVAALHTLASRAAISSDWQQSWDAMISYAATKGWLSADGAQVLAHLVDLPPRAHGPH